MKTPTPYHGFHGAANFGIDFKNSTCFCKALLAITNRILIVGGYKLAFRVSNAAISGICRALVLLLLEEANAAVAFLRPDDLRRIILRVIIHNQ